ncbi:ATP-binding protein [Thermobifida halotolerans]|uniref:ATP-binding protein n=1 Tax=Thermobifida halotolerans TaxID=483545 RepID=A0AA97M4U0_9ACTN|nr:NACHT domain-containing protein [Thermobifida halotolerans]UOE20456.1 ATP-binding protein [Thermobifida halotolerans]
MAKKTLSYADALRILGGDDPTLLGFGEAVGGGTLGALGVPDVLGLQSLLVRCGHAAVTGIREKITGVSRWDRTERVAAADLILRITALFEALDELLDRPECPLALKDLRITGDEQYALLTDVLRDAERAAPALPPSSDGVEHAPPYRRSAQVLRRFLRGLEAWDRLDETGRARLDETLEELPDLARRRHVESYRKLAADVPEFGVWANLAAHEDTRGRVEEVRVGLAGMADLLERMTAPGTARRLTELERLYRAVLDKPVLDTDETPDGVVLPPVREAYLDLGGLLRVADADARPSADTWWEGAARHDNLQPLLVSLLTRRECHFRPVVLLGHPGAGKSQLTRMLAARLPSGDFLPLRVELRSVQADAPIHTQIDEGLSATLHTRVSWRDLADQAEGALPVVILDGLDELLQATGADRSDYLEQVQRFQEHQADLGRPVAVIVTSRTVVAERTRFPLGTPVIRLEPFTDAQITCMLRIWNRANAAALAARGLRPLEPETLLDYRELAEQPLLLFMLLVFDADGNALQRDAAALGRAELYERLLTSFAEREVRKHHSHLGGAELARAVEDELRRLEVVATAMFVRHRQWVSADELDADLAALFPDAAVRPEQAGLGGRTGPAHQVLGRFFFVHEARAVRREEHRSVYEFLHATFGEYLVARAVVNELSDLVADRAHAARRRVPVPPDTGRFHALTSFAALAGRAAVVEFAADLLAARTREARERAEYRSLLVEMFRAAPYPRTGSAVDYRPYEATIARRLAAHTANLVTLLVLVADEVDLAELFPDSGQPWLPWRETAGTWRALPGDEWFGFMDTVRLRHLGHWEEDGTPRALLRRERREPVNVGECTGFELRVNATGRLDITDPYTLTVDYEGTTSRLLRSLGLRMQGWSARLVLMLGPYLKHVDSDLGTWVTADRAVRIAGRTPEHVTVDHWDFPSSWTTISHLLDLRLGWPGTDEDWDNRLLSYLRLLDLARTSHPRLDVPQVVALREAVEDLHLLRLRPSPPDRPSPYNELRSVLALYLQRVHSVAGSPRVTASLRLVLDALRPYLEEAEEYDQNYDRILGLAAANDGPSDSDHLPEHLPHLPQDTPGGFTGNSL